MRVCEPSRNENSRRHSRVLAFAPKRPLVHDLFVELERLVNCCLLEAQAAGDLFDARVALDNGLISRTHLASLAPYLDFFGTRASDHGSQTEIADIGVEAPSDPVLDIWPVTVIVREVAPL